MRLTLHIYGARHMSVVQRQIDFNTSCHLVHLFLVQRKTRAHTYLLQQQRD